jgi:hypothetical protein
MTETVVVSGTLLPGITRPPWLAGSSAVSASTAWKYRTCSSKFSGRSPGVPAN